MAVNGGRGLGVGPLRKQENLQKDTFISVIVAIFVDHNADVDHITST